MNLYEIMLIERNKLVKTLVENSIISKDELKSKDLTDKLSIMFNEIQKIIESNSDSLEKVYNTIIDNFWLKIENVIKNTPGLTIGIKDNNTNNELYIYHGKTSDKQDANNIDNNTLFDLASVTKLFTSTRILKEAENGNIALTKPVNYYVPQLKNINVPLIDVAKFYYQINTDGRLDTAENKEELITRLYNSKIADENSQVYSDIPYIILAEILKNIDSNFYKFFHKELGMINTDYNVENRIITGGNINNLKQIHDPKAKKMKEFGLTDLGHAGLYSTSKDLVKFGVHLLPNSTFLSKNSIVTLRTPSKNEFQYIDKKTQEITNKNRAMGVYIQTDKGIKQSDIAINSSKEAFAAAGTTGQYVLVDPTNNFTFNYLCNPYSQKKELPIITINGIQTRWVTLTNVIKEELMNLVYELRYATNVFDTLSKTVESNNLSNEVEKVFKSNKSINR